MQDVSSAGNIVLKNIIMCICSDKSVIGLVPEYCLSLVAKLTGSSLKNGSTTNGSFLRCDAWSDAFGCVIIITIISSS